VLVVAAAGGVRGIRSPTDGIATGGQMSGVRDAV